MKNYLLIIFILLVLGCNQKPSQKQAINISVELDTIVSGIHDDFVWSQAYVTAYGEHQDKYLATMSKQYIRGVDNYGDLYVSFSDDGESWTEPELIKSLISPDKNPRYDSTFSDVYPMWHESTGKVIATGKVFFYDREQMPDPETGRGAGYVVYDPELNKWTGLKMMEFPPLTPDGDSIHFPSAGCSQPYHLSNGKILQPIMYEEERVDNDERNASFVAKCSFDGDKLTVEEIGDPLRLDQGRGIYEPSVTKYGDTYYLTLRSDGSAHVATSDDGIHYGEHKAWRFTNGNILGSYNTQQHWISNSRGLFLVYTRRGANNDHIMRHRAPLFMSRVDTSGVRVFADEEKIVLPERGARLGNFGVCVQSDELTVVAAAERIGSDQRKDSAAFAEVRKLGYNNTLFFSKIRFK